MRGRLLLAVALSVAGAVPAAAQTLKVAVDKTPEVGRQAPDFNLPWATKDTVSVSEAPFNFWKTRGQVVVLAFYPRDFSTGCTAEMQTFRDQFDSLFGNGVVVVGISGDSVSTHQRFAQSMSLPFPLLSDTGLRVAAEYGVKNGASVKRSVFVIGKDGRIRYRDLEFRALDPGSYDKLRVAVKAARR